MQKLILSQTPTSEDSIRLCVDALLDEYEGFVCNVMQCMRSKGQFDGFAGISLTGCCELAWLFHFYPFSLRRLRRIVSWLACQHDSLKKNCGMKWTKVEQPRWFTSGNLHTAASLHTHESIHRMSHPMCSTGWTTSQDDKIYPSVGRQENKNCEILCWADTPSLDAALDLQFCLLSGRIF